MTAAAIGFSVTISLFIAMLLYSHDGEGNQLDFFLMVTWALSLLPVRALLGIFGWQIQLDMTVGKEGFLDYPFIIGRGS